MMESGRSKNVLEELLKVGVVMLAMVIGYAMGRYSAPVASAISTSSVTRGTRTPRNSPIGEKISLPDADWKKNQRTLVLALQIGCHFCSESSSFYQSLIQERARFGNIQFMAVLPQTVEESKDYLNRLGVAVDDVRQSSLGQIGVLGTPTLLLVNGAGVVTEAWDGKLQPEQEKCVLARLRVM
jgi:hypothetical protein